MMFLRYLALLSLTALLFPAVTLARNRNEHNVNLTDPVQVGHAHLKARQYKVEWNGSGPNVQVAFFEHGKQVVTTPATLKTNDKQVTRDDFAIPTIASHLNVLRENRLRPSEASAGVPESRYIANTRLGEKTRAAEV